MMLGLTLELLRMLIMLLILILIMLGGLMANSRRMRE
jgi:hypothetical protein